MSRQITIATPTGAVTVNEKSTKQKNYSGVTYNEKSTADGGGGTPVVKRRRASALISS